MYTNKHFTLYFNKNFYFNNVIRVVEHIIKKNNHLQETWPSDQSIDVKTLMMSIQEIYKPNSICFDGDHAPDGIWNSYPISYFTVGENKNTFKVNIYVKNFNNYQE